MESSGIYLAAARTVADTVDRLPASGWEGPGLGEWDLRALVGHTSRSLITVLTYLDRPVEAVVVATPEAYYAHIAGVSLDQDAVAERGREAGRVLGPDPAAAFRELLGRVQARLEQAGDDDVIDTIAGGMRVKDYLPTRTFELVAHGLDIARVTGIACEFATEVMAEACALAGRTSAELGTGPTFLAAVTGRAPLPAGFSIV